MEKMRFEGKVVIVTGASSGIGRSTARLFAMEGAKVVAAARRLKRLEDLRDKVAAENAPGVILPVKTDVRDPAQIDAMFDTCLKEFGHLDILVNNAGFGKLGDYGEIDPRDHYDIANLNCAALSAVTGTVLPYMHAGAHIVNVCSIAAFAPTPRMTVYCSTKAFVYSFSKALRAELRKKQIGVTAVCPGPMDTSYLFDKFIENIEKSKGGAQ